MVFVLCESSTLSVISNNYSYCHLMENMVYLFTPEFKNYEM